MNQRGKPHTNNSLPVEKPIFIYPFSDFGFKLLFGCRENSDLSTDLLNAVLEGERVITNIVLLPVERLGTTKDTRKVIFDAEGKTEDGLHLIVEMQEAAQSFIKARNIFYAAANLYHQLSPGDQGFKLKELTCICFANFIFDKTYPHQVVQTIKLSVQENNEVFYNQLIFKYIELPKFKKKEHKLITRLDKWLFALTNMIKLKEIPLILRGDSVFEKLFRIAKLSTLNKKQMTAYQHAEMDRMDYLRGMNVSRMEGKVEEKTTIARLLKATKVSIKIISKCTGLTEEEVKQL